jgi:hypothetical protein
MSSILIRCRILAIAILLLLLSHLSAAQSAQSGKQTVSPKHTKTYQLKSWKNVTCGAKGRFQDREYCASKVIDQIVADGKAAIPILISQITDNHLIKEQVINYWPQLRAGELALFILENLFLDDTWKHETMPDLFNDRKCDEGGYVCWEQFRKRYSLADIQKRWTVFWTANQDNIFWDDKSRCFRLKNQENN